MQILNYAGQWSVILRQNSGTIYLQKECNPIWSRIEGCPGWPSIGERVGFVMVGRMWCNCIQDTKFNTWTESTESKSILKYPVTTALFLVNNFILQHTFHFTREIISRDNDEREIPQKSAVAKSILIIQFFSNSELTHWLPTFNSDCPHFQISILHCLYPRLVRCGKIHSSLLSSDSNYLQRAKPSLGQLHPGVLRRDYHYKKISELALKLHILKFRTVMDECFNGLLMYVSML